MRSSILFCLVPVALCAAASPSPANVTISNAATENMTCSGGVCSPTAADAVLNVQELAAMLASGNAKVTTTGSGVQATNIHVNAPLTWSAGTTLALDAFHSIEVNRKVTVAGAGGVSLTTNDGGSGGDFACNDNGAITFANMSSPLTINGTQYMLVNSVASLASAIAANPSGAFALAKNYNAAKDGTYALSPIPTAFSGSFNGLGNAISNLSINDSTTDSYVGLFAETTGGSIANARLVNENVQGGFKSLVGGLVGIAGGAVIYSFNSGRVSGDDGDVGGLLGMSVGVVKGSGSAATVPSGWNAGGLIADANWGVIIDSWATGNVSGGCACGSSYVGGLVGYDLGADIKHSWASGQVYSAAYGEVGGLVGYLEYGYALSIERSHATGAVTCTGACGGLVGFFGGKISQSYATGTVTAISLSVDKNTGAGGLVGDGYGCFTCEIENSYALGAVAAAHAGGLAGWNGQNSPYHSILNSYASGAVKSATWAGGLIGWEAFPYGSSNIKHAYWDMTTSGISDPSQGAGNIANDPGIKGLSDKKLKSGLPKGFDPKIWNEDSNINGGLPYLLANPPTN